MIIARDCDPLRRSEWSMLKNWGLFTIFHMRARLSEVKKTEDFLRFLRCATICGDSRGRGAKTEDFLRFLRSTRDPLRRSAWSRCKNWGLFTISAVHARPFAKIMVKVQKHVFLISAARAKSAWSRCKNSRFCAFFAVAEIVRVEAARKMAFGKVVAWFAHLLQSRGRGFHSPLVRGIRLENRSFGTMQLAQTTFVRNRAAELVQSTLRRADSCRANLHRASCTEPLAKSSLRRANFHRAKLRRAILHRAKLRERALQKLWPSCKLCY